MLGKGGTAEGTAEAHAHHTGFQCRSHGYEVSGPECLGSRFRDMAFREESQCKEPEVEVPDGLRGQ